MAWSGAGKGACGLVDERNIKTLLRQKVIIALSTSMSDTPSCLHSAVRQIVACLQELGWTGAGHEASPPDTSLDIVPWFLYRVRTLCALRFPFPALIDVVSYSLS